jgi:hypothetical protein
MVDRIYESSDRFIAPEKAINAVFWAIVSLWPAAAIFLGGMILLNLAGWK